MNNNYFRKLFAPIAIGFLALGATVTANYFNKTVVAEAASSLSKSFNFLDGGDSGNSAYASVDLSTNVSYASDNPGGTSGTTLWEADYANLSMTTATRLGGKLVSVVQTDDTTAWANIKTKFSFAAAIEKVEILGVATFGTAGNVTALYLQSSTTGTTWTTQATTTNKSGTISFDTLTIPTASYLRFGIALTASGTNSGIGFTGIRVYEPVGSVISVTGVSLNKTSTSLWVGDTDQLTATVSPSDATDKSVAWSTLNSAVATVSSSGLVSAVGAGSTTIRVTTTDGSFIADCSVTVTPVSVTGVTLDKTSVEIIAGHTDQLTATVAPANATNKSVTWSSSDETKVTVSSSGLVTAVAATSSPVDVTVTTIDGSFTDSVSVTVTADPFVLVNSYSFNGTGNANWPVTTGMGAYFTSGYGVASASTGGTVKSLMLLKDIVVGSQIRVEIASVTNHATNTTNVSVYGLDYSGSRISGLSGTYTNPTNGGASTLETLTARALANKGIIVLSVSLSTKVYGVEVVFETSLSRSLLAQIDVYSKVSSDSDQAIAFANLVNSDVGDGAAGSCSAILDVLHNDYTLLSVGAKAIVDGSSDSAFVNARARIAYLEAYVGATPSPIFDNIDGLGNGDTSMMMIIIIAGIGLTAMGAYLIGGKKKEDQA